MNDQHTTVNIFNGQSVFLNMDNHFSDKLPQLINSQVEEEHAFRFLVYVNAIAFVVIFLAANGLGVDELITIVTSAYSLFILALIINLSKYITAKLDSSKRFFAWRLGLSYLVYDCTLAGILLINAQSDQPAPTIVAVIIVVMAGFMNLTVNPRSISEFLSGKMILLTASLYALYIDPSDSMMMTFPLLIAFILMSISAYWIFVIRLRAMSQRLEQQYALNQLQVETDLRDRLMTYIGHDLRQPINAIGMLLHAMPQNDQNIIEAKECVRSSKRLISDIVQLADFHKELSASNELFSVQSLFDSIELEYSFAASQANCQLRFVRTRMELVNDYKYIARIIKNYVSNAIIHAAGSKILVGVRRRKHCIDILVIDNGPGISDSDKNRVFDEFVKGESSWQDIGFGLGLAIAKHYADVCNVEILFDSEQAHGSMFGLRFAL
ncbi:MAG: sensor histidine kinase [Arenicella sp.]